MTVTSTIVKPYSILVLNNIYYKKIRPQVLPTLRGGSEQVLPIPTQKNVTPYVGVLIEIALLLYRISLNMSRIGGKYEM